MAENRSQITAALLLDWFAGNARSLPWRSCADPYAVWISEIMLQQTRSATVIPYFERWMEAMPDLDSLARADLSRLHKLWEGLGYYTRVRNLQKAAQRIRLDFGGKFPSCYEDILSLPGVGRYTAGAIASIALGQALPALDGNGMRVLSRLHGVRGCIRQPSVERLLWEHAGALVQAAAQVGAARAGNPCGDLNQSIIELGATVCLPRRPDCRRCPLERDCRARKEGLTRSIPDRGRPPQIRRRSAVAIVLRHEDRCLIGQRRAGGINGLLWEFPQRETGEEDPQGLLWLRDDWRLERENLCYWGEIRHSITTSRIRLSVYAAWLGLEGLVEQSGYRWVGTDQLGDYAFTGAHRRIVRWIRLGKVIAPGKLRR